MEPILVYGFPLGSSMGLVAAFEWLGQPYRLSRVDMLADMKSDAYGRLKDNPNVRTEITKPYYWLVMVMNKKKGIFSD